MDTIKENLTEIQANIERAKNRSPYKQDVQIIAVTKSVSLERTQEAFSEGVLHLGENRPEGLDAKYAYLSTDAQWHYIGSLQTRKVKQVLPLIDYLHSLDRLSLAEEIEKRAEVPVKCFVQVNVSGEQTKHGLNADEAIEFIKQLQPFSKIQVIGLMTMAPLTEDSDIIRQVFKNLKMLQQQVVSLNLAYAPCSELSMGMSNDYEIAIEEGATFVRIGTALVG